MLLMLTIFNKNLRLFGRHKIGGKTSSATTRHERNSMGSSNDGAKLGKELSVE